MLSLLTKYKSHRFAKYVIALLILFSIYLPYRIYIWSNTQSTDNAYVDADISAISSEITGVLIKVLVSDNTRVKAGDLIAEIDDRDYKARLRSLNAAINASIKDIEIVDQKILIEQIKLDQGKEKLDFAIQNLQVNKIDYKRNQDLKSHNFTSNKTLDISKIDFIKANTDHNQAKLDLQVTTQNLHLLSLQKLSQEENLAKMIEDRKLVARSLENTKIIAPVDGILSNSNLQIGNFVAPGRILFFIVQDSTIYVQANFKETQIRKFLPNHKVSLSFDSLPGKVIYGRIRSFSPATGSKFSLIPTDNATGNFTKIVQRVPVLIDFDSDEFKGKLVPGMSCVVSIRTDKAALE